MELEPYSRFLKTSPIRYDNKDTFGLWTKIQLDNTEDFVVPNSLEGRPDLISDLQYDTPVFWWVIVAFNHPEEIIGFPKTGQVIKIPRRSELITGLI